MTNPNSLLASLRFDQRARWQRDDAVQVEAYLEQYPSLRCDPEAVLDLIWNELLLRQERGDAPQLTDYQRRFDAFELQLRVLFQQLQVLAPAPRTDAHVARGFTVLPDGGYGRATKPIGSSRCDGL